METYEVTGTIEFILSNVKYALPLEDRHETWTVNGQRVVASGKEQAKRIVLTAEADTIRKTHYVDLNEPIEWGKCKVRLISEAALMEEIGTPSLFDLETV